MRSGKHNSEEVLHQPFKDLKNLLKTKKKMTMNTEAKAPSGQGRENSSLPCIGQTKDAPITDDELFRDAMKEVREIREFREIPVHQKKNAFRSKCKNAIPDQEALKTLEEIVRGRKAVILSDTQEYIEWINRDYHEDIIDKLHKGQYSVQDCLDLHGIIVEEAEKEVELFLNGALRKGYRCVKIIHGRGLRSVKGPVLKQALITWLLYRYRKNIIAFVTARQCDGGLGALYVLLR
jgi:DNA-nicking Smr family endonuclease